jgi:hypothetical protein
MRIFVKGEVEKQYFVLGYCETFERFAFEIRDNNEGIVLQKFPSSFDVLANLKNDKIDYGLIGRRAYSFEIDEDIKETPLQEFGFTLVSNEKGFIDYRDLKNLEIHTYLSEDIVKEFFDFQNITYQNKLSANLETPRLISWEDWNDSFELFIPIENGKKVEKFRTPMLYSRLETNQIVVSKVEKN